MLGYWVNDQVINYLVEAIVVIRRIRTYALPADEGKVIGAITVFYD